VEENKILQVNLNKIFDNFKSICIEAFKNRFLWGIFILMFILSLVTNFQNKNFTLLQVIIFGIVLNIFIKNPKKVFMFILASVIAFMIFMFIMFTVIFVFNQLNLSSIVPLIILAIISLYTILFLYFLPFLIFTLKYVQDISFVDILKDFLKILVFSFKIKVKNYFKAFLFILLAYIFSVIIGVFLTFIFKENIGIVVSVIVMNILTTAFIVSIANSIEK